MKGEVHRRTKPERAPVFRAIFKDNQATLKQRHGFGVYSWAQGMTRRIARRISRDMARKGVLIRAAKPVPVKAQG